jgi:hypothetical protein
MSDTEKKAPTHRAYFVKGKADAAKWLELGAVWEHNDGKGFDVVLDRMPLEGDRIIRDALRYERSSRRRNPEHEHT